MSFDGARGLRLTIDAGARVCPLAALGLYADGQHALKEGGNGQ